MGVAATVGSCAGGVEIGMTESVGKEVLAEQEASNRATNIGEAGKEITSKFCVCAFVDRWYFPLVGP